MANQGQMLSDLDLFAKYGVSRDYLDRLSPAERKSIEEQGFQLSENSPALPGLPGSDASNPLTGDQPGPSTVDENGITAVSARDVDVPPEDDLDALTADTVRLQQATRDRRAADKMREDQQQVLAARQKVADDVQRALGNAQRVSQVTQSGIRQRVLSAADRLGAIRTPGGILSLVLIIIVLRLVLIEANGQPPLVWLYLVLTGRAHLMSEEKAANVGKAGITEAKTSNAAETIPTSANQAQQGAQTATLTAIGVLPTTSATPANAVSSLLNGASSALDRYIHP